MKKIINKEIVQTNITLISTHSVKHQGEIIHDPLGIQILSWYLKKNVMDINLNLIDTQLSSKEDLFEELSFTQPSIIWISVRAGTIEITKDIVDWIKELILLNLLDKETILVLWGNMPSINPKMFIEEYPDILVWIKEWEYTLEWIIDYYRWGRNIDEIPNLVYMSPKWEIHYNEEQKFNMDDRAVPDRQLTKKVLMKWWIIWAEAATRSCDHGCVFCSVHKLHKWKFQSGDAYKVVEDLENLIKMWVKVVNFSDDEWWTDDIESMVKLAELIIEKWLDIKRTISTRVDKIVPNDVTEEYQEVIINKIQLLQKSWLSRLFLGIESWSDTQLKRYNKKVTAYQNEEAIGILNDLGLAYTAGFITFDFLMSLDELKENLIFLKKTWLYKNITNPFSIIRIHDGTSYKIMLKNKWLLWSVSIEEPLLYTAKFKDMQVWEIAGVAWLLVAECYEDIFSIKSMLQGDDNKLAIEKLNQIRSIDIDILEKLIIASEKWKIDDDFISNLKDNYAITINKVLK